MLRHPLWQRRRKGSPMRASLLAVPALFALAACDGGTQGAGITDEETTPDERAIAAGAVSSEEAAVTEVGAAASSAGQIPVSMQGRWGLTSADCEPGRDDAKGLLTISGKTLEFYESVGSLSSIEESANGRLRAAFDFTGEGMTWERDIVLDVQDEGETLIRREYGEDAAPGPFRYARCSAA